MTLLMIRSINQMIKARIKVVTITRIAELCNLSHVGHVTLVVSSFQDSFT